MTAQSAQAALQILQERNFSILISDLAMPTENDYQLIRGIRALNDSGKAAIPAIALSALAGAQESQRALEAGFQKHLVKPVDFEELIQSIAQLGGP